MHRCVLVRDCELSVLQTCNFCGMAPRNSEREAAVKTINRIAAGVDLARITENAGRPKVQQLIDAVRGHVDCIMDGLTT